MQTVHVDASYGEGGGQVVRTSLSLAALLGVELTLDRIRAGRSKPGLAAQHVTCVRAAASICGGEVEGDEVSSSALRFRPGALRPGRHGFNVADVRPSAGSAGLVLQTVLLPLLFSGGDSTVVVQGGTNVPWSPCHEYLRGTFLPALARGGAKVSLERPRAGWYPAGGGRMEAAVRALDGPLQPLRLTQRGQLRALEVTSTVSEGLPAHILERQARAALDALPPDMARAAQVTHDHVPAGGPGTCLALDATFAAGHGGATALGERGKPAGKVGADAAGVLNDFLSTGAAVDLHLADQLLLPAALADGVTELVAEASTEHLRTNAWVVQQFLDIPITLEGDSPVHITVEGVALRPRRADAVPGMEEGS